MKKSAAIFTILLSISTLSAQPAIQWQKCLGGTMREAARHIQQTSDGGFVVVGITFSSNGDVWGNQGGGDWWIVKLDEFGEIQWKRSLGGSSTETAQSVCQTSDGGYVIAGQTYSNNGHVSGNHGDWDYWVVKLDAAGHLQWQKTLGGSADDQAYSIRQTMDGGYIVAGYTTSNDGDISEVIGYADIWIVKLDNLGEIQWERSYGGTNGDERAYSIQQTKDGGYVVAGETNSTDGDVVGNHGNTDCWVLKLDSTGNIEWQRALGGTGSDRGWGIVQTTDEGYAIIGYAGSFNGDVTGWKGLHDYWIVKLDKSGVLEWQKTLGGSKEDWGRSICQTKDGGFAVVGITQSNNGDVLENSGQDIWAVKLNHVGELQWQITLGGSNAEWANVILQTEDGGFIIAGETFSNDGDVSGNRGESDFWVVKLTPESVGTHTLTPQAANLSLFPNPASHSITIHIPTSGTPIESPILVTITDLLGRECRTQTITNGGNVNLATLPNGFYLLTAIGSTGQRFVGKFRKQE